MTSSQVTRSTGKKSDNVQPNTGLANRSLASSVPVNLDGENAFVTGALQVSQDSSGMQQASQGPKGSIAPVSRLRQPLLEDLESAPSVALVPSPENQDAISVALPESIDDESSRQSLNVDAIDGQRSQNQGSPLQESLVPDTKSYASTIESLSLHLPHLNNVRKSSRHMNVSVTCYDYLNNSLTSVNVFTKTTKSRELQTPEGISLLRHLSQVPSENFRLRLLVADDLSTDLIECLGSWFSISPEVYEEHLVNSGWQNGICNDDEPDTWITRDMKKNHTSIRWYRPVKRITQRPYSRQDRRMFLDSNLQYSYLSWVEKVRTELGKVFKVKHKTTPTTNIFRSAWDIKTDTDATMSIGGFTAWEERATVWSKECAGGYYVG